jgi:hypothetical protein
MGADGIKWDNWVELGSRLSLIESVNEDSLKGFGHWKLVIGHLFDICHLKFVINKMGA